MKRIDKEFGDLQTNPIPGVAIEKDNSSNTT